MSWEVPTMQSKTSCFNRAVFRKTLSRCWPLWAGAAIILFFWLPFVLANVSTQPVAGEPADVVIPDTILHATQSLPLLVCLFGLCFAAATFDYLFSRRSTGMMASLPLKREGLFCSSFAAGLVMLLSVGLLTAALTAIITLTKGVHDLSAVWTWLGVYSMEAVTFYAIGVFCAMLTGQVLVLIPLYALVNFGGVFLCGILNYMARMLLIGVPTEKSFAAFAWLEFLSPCEKLLVDTGVDYQLLASRASVVGVFSGWPVVIGYFLVGLVLAAGALGLFGRRKMEYAEEPATGKALGQTLKYIVTSYCALGFPAFLELFFGGGIAESTTGLLLFTALGAGIGYLISEMILHKSVRVLKTSWKGLLITAAAALLVVGAMKLDVFGYVHRVPDAGDVANAELRTYHLKTELTDSDDLKDLTDLHRDLIEVQPDGVYRAQELVITYTLKNGKTLSRAYAVNSTLATESLKSRVRELFDRADTVNSNHDPYHELTEDVIEWAQVEWTEPADGEAGAADAYTGTFTTYELERADALALFENGIQPDIEAGVFPNWDGSENELPSAPCVVIQLQWPEEGTQALNYFITPDCVNTLAWLAAHGYEIPGI